MKQQIIEMIQAGEGFHLEFKESLDKGFIEEVCAFANSSGGKILLGVSDDGTVKGFNPDNRHRSMIQDTLRGLQPNLDIKITIEDNIVVVDVPEGSDKPYACSKGFFIRSGANSQKLSRNEIVEFFQKEGRIRYDELRNERADFENDFDEKAFETFIKSSRISPSIDRFALLKNLDCLTHDNRLTNAGVLFFAKDIDFLINHAIVVCVLYKGTEKIHILDKKDFKANLVENINNSILFVQRHTNVEYVIEKLKRDEIPDIPEVALRESIVNAVCHRDYFDKRANVVIEIFDDRVVISNPGGLPTGLKPAEFGSKSVSRNPVIASLLHTGINRIKDSVAENSRSRVEFHYDDFFTVTFFRNRLPKSSEKTGGTPETTEKNEGLSEGLSEGLTTLIQAIKENPGIKAKELASNLQRPVKTIERQIKSLSDKGIIERIGSRKTGGYHVKK